ncbi:hypothetical protein NT04LS_2103 [Listeria seeligeri FSL S4-171]|uniref:hypothetical protein n=1 Tax=Listeria seeligeri TaxID=1640 RepID=UPI0001EB821C|nr:hypothetical protein [Listeria seeligeri]EFS02809.1 hypothetical protein NT04LS_2103 [Listeria seeligeri FSL S4-171]
MFNKWLMIYSNIADNPLKMEALKCPNCKNMGTIDYYFIPYTINNELGSAYIWCNDCKKGIHLDRVGIPKNTKIIIDESIKLDEVIPSFKEVTPEEK